jgi:hypothetical protein
MDRRDCGSCVGLRPEAEDRRASGEDLEVTQKQSFAAVVRV